MSWPVQSGAVRVLSRDQGPVSVVEVPRMLESLSAEAGETVTRTFRGHQGGVHRLFGHAHPQRPRGGPDHRARAVSWWSVAVRPTPWRTAQAWPGCELPLLLLRRHALTTGPGHQPDHGRSACWCSSPTARSPGVPRGRRSGGRLPHRGLLRWCGRRLLRVRVASLAARRPSFADRLLQRGHQVHQLTRPRLRGCGSWRSSRLASITS